MSIVQVIQYEGDNSTFVWKHPKTNFNTLSQLIVHESQEAILFVDGKAMSLYGPGRHTLELQQAPKAGGFLRGITGGKNPFHSEIYFINKTVQMSIKWGTDTKVRFLDPTLGVPLELGACGEMNLSVADSRKLLVKLVGTTKGIAWDSSPASFTQSLQEAFRPLISTGVKTHLATCIKEQAIDILQIDEQLQPLSLLLQEKLFPEFAEYGLSVPQFYITRVLLPEEDPNFKRIRELRAVTLHTKTIEAEAAITAAERKVELERQTTQTEIARQQAERELIRAQASSQSTRLAGMAEADVMRAKGYTQRDVLQADVQKAYAQGIGSMQISGGAGGVTGDMVGLGVGLAAAGVVSGQLGEMFHNINPGSNTGRSVCSQCAALLTADARFCPSCGQAVASAIPQTQFCPQCGKPVTAGKFCSECGAVLAACCPKCGKELAAGTKFCPECGERL